mgnify:FL=1
MKITTLFVAFVAFFTQLVNAQNDRKDDISDVSFYSIIPFDTAQTARPLLWFWYDGGKDGAFYETRLNFDALNTGALIVGKTFGNEKFFITPKAGALIAFDELGFDGITTEFNAGGEISLGELNKGLSFKGFTMNQFAFATDDNPNFAYNYTQIGLCGEISEEIFFEINYSFQIFQEVVDGSEPWIDMGPQIKISIGNFYIKPWATFDPNHKGQEKFIVGIGYTFK